MIKRTGRLWTVVRFPSGHWSTGGGPDCPDYAQCEVWQVTADTREQAKRKAQRIRYRTQRAQAQKDSND